MKQDKQNLTTEQQGIIHLHKEGEFISFKNSQKLKINSKLTRGMIRKHVNQNAN